MVLVIDWYNNCDHVCMQCVTMCVRVEIMYVVSAGDKIEDVFRLLYF